LIVRVGAGVRPEQVEARLQPAAQALALTITARTVAKAAPEVTPATHVVSVYGADRPGIVYRVSERLAEAGANITELTSRVIGTSDQPVYALLMETACPPEIDLDRLLGSLKDELGVEISIGPAETGLL